MSKQAIKGVVVFDLDTKKYSFIEYLTKESFKNGVFFTDYTKVVYVCDHEIEIEIPDDFDIIKPQLAALDAKEKELTLQYKQALNHIKVQRNNLLAIEHGA